MSSRTDPFCVGGFGDGLSIRRRAGHKREGEAGTLTVLCFIAALALFPESGRCRSLLAHFYYVNEPSSWQSLEANYTHISLVSPQWFALDEQGVLESTVEPALVAWARQQRLPLMPLLINQKFRPEVAHAILTDETTQSRALSHVAEAAASYRFYGIQLDFENIPAEDRDRYTRFAKRLADECRRRRLKLSVAVVAPLASAASPALTESGVPARPPHPQSLAFDYRELARVCNFISLMTYDQHTSPDNPGPIAGYPWVEACLRKILEYVPRNKLLLGVPLYYRRWRRTSVSEGSYGEAQIIIAGAQAQVRMDPENREKTASFYEGDERTIVWFEDSETLREKLSLVKKYRLRGFSAWRLGHEDPAAWRATFPANPAKVR